MIYKTDFTYHVLIDVDVKFQTYSVYVSDYKGNTVTVAANYAFRCESGNIGKITVRGGNYVSSGLFTVKNLYVSDKAVDIVKVKSDHGVLLCDVLNYCDESVKVYAGFYGEDGEIVGISTAVAEEKGLSRIKITEPEKYEKAKVMIWGDDVSPITESMAEYNKEDSLYEIGEVLTSSHQDENAFVMITPENKAAIYSFDLMDNGSLDSGIIFGNSNVLNTSAKNYFAKGSIVILFAKGKMYVRDDESKKEVCEYKVGEKVRVEVEAGIITNTYDLYVNGERVAENVKFRTKTDCINCMALVENNNGGKMFEICDFKAD